MIQGEMAYGQKIQNKNAYLSLPSNRILGRLRGNLQLYLVLNVHVNPQTTVHLQSIESFIVALLSS